MALKLLWGGVPLDTLYGPKGAHTATLTGLQQNGTEVAQLLLALADGHALGFNIGCAKNGTDMSAFFGVTSGNTPLPIDGGNYTASAHSGTTTSVASLVFTMNNTGWVLTRNQSPNGGGGTIASGPLPAGAVTAQFTLNVTSSTSSTTSSNSAPTNTTISATTLTASVQATSAPSNPEHSITATLQINYLNSGGTNISQTNLTINANAIGAS